MARINVNGQTPSNEAEPGTPLLWVLREQLGLTGTECGQGCGCLPLWHLHPSARGDLGSTARNRTGACVPSPSAGARRKWWRSNAA